MKTLPQALFISHGAGPLPLFEDRGHRQMLACLQGIAAGMPRPDAIVVVSAHWEEQVPTLTASARPALIYDYYGFPPESYTIQYPCAGEPSLAREIYRLFEKREIKARLDETRGFDHGLFVPLKIMYPAADIPCVQLSLVNTLDASFHIEMGKALHSLARQGVLVIGSGFSFHNLRAFFAPASAEELRLNEAFEEWLLNVCASPELSEDTRRERLSHWKSAPGAEYCHPREEHLLPLHVCYGVSQAPCSQTFKATIMKKKSSMYLW